MTIKRPARLRGRGYSDALALYAVEAKDKAETGAQPAQAVHWRLLTTHAVTSFEAALLCIDWYRLRWYIEQVFRLLKKQGLHVESSRLERGESLIKLCVLALGAALDVMRLLLASQDGSDQPIGQVFSPQEQQCLAELGRRLEGDTARQQNPNAAGTLVWAAWIIARLGGWKGYASQSRAGPLTFYEGLRRFRLTFEGWKLAKRLVYNT